MELYETESNKQQLITFQDARNLSKFLTNAELTHAKEVPETTDKSILRSFVRMTNINIY